MASNTVPAQFTRIIVHPWGPGVTRPVYPGEAQRGVRPHNGQAAKRLWQLCDSGERVGMVLDPRAAPVAMERAPGPGPGIPAIGVLCRLRPPRVDTAAARGFDIVGQCRLQITEIIAPNAYEETEYERDGQEQRPHEWTAMAQPYLDFAPAAYDSALLSATKDIMADLHARVALASPSGAEAQLRGAVSKALESEAHGMHTIYGMHGMTGLERLGFELAACVPLTVPESAALLISQDSCGRIEWLYHKKLAHRLSAS